MNVFWSEIKREIDRFLDQRDRGINIKERELTVRTAEALINAGQVSRGKRMIEQDL